MDFSKLKQTAESEFSRSVYLKREWGSLLNSINRIERAYLEPETIPPKRNNPFLPIRRVEAALKDINTPFTRAELHIKANGDGLGTIPYGTFCPIFSKLFKSGQIVCVEGEFGKRKSIYSKTETPTE